MFVNTLADQKEVRPQLLVDCGVVLCPVVTQRPHAVSVPERFLVIAAPCDWRDAEWSQRRVRPSVRACMGARVSFPDTGNSYESGVYVCLQSPGMLPPETEREAVRETTPLHSQQTHSKQLSGLRSYSWSV